MITRTIKGTNIELTPAIDSAADRLVQSLEKYVDADDTGALAEVEVGRTTAHHRTGEIFRAEINFRSRLGTFRAEAEAVDLYAALSLVKDQIVETLRSRKAKKIDFVRRNAVKLKNMLKGLPWSKGSR